MMRRPLDRDRLIHYTRVAMYQFREDAAVFRNSKPNALVTGDALKRLGAEFARYAKEAAEMLEVLEESYEVTREFEDDAHDYCTKASCEHPSHNHEDTDG